VRWQVNVLADCHATKVVWGMSGSPLVLDNRVIVNAGISPNNNTGESVVAYDRGTGKRLWAAGKHAAGYSSPQLCTLDGQEQVLIFDGGGLAGIDPANGTELWRHPWSTFSDMNTAQPLVVGSDRVFISSELKNGCALLRVHRPAQEGAAWTTEVVWQNRNLCTKYANPVLAAGHIYGLRDGRLVCLDAETGNLCWSGARYGMGQLLVAGDKLIVITDAGEVVLLALDPKEARELGRLEVLKYKTWNTPALAGNQLFVRNERDMTCVELPVSK
jgi:outer membrane protein assembly factor BamB